MEGSFPPPLYSLFTPLHAPLHFPSRSSVLVEAAIDSIEQARVAVADGVDRLEVCSNLDVGGLTPAPALLDQCLALGVPCAAMARPRAGNFVYDDAERARLMEDVAMLLSHGADAIVFGALTSDGEVDAEVVRKVVGLCGKVPVVFHRAFDEGEDQFRALETLVACRVTRVLTSGGSATAVEGAARISELVVRARGRITVLAGGKVRADNAALLVERTGVKELHYRELRRGKAKSEDEERGGMGEG